MAGEMNIIEILRSGGVKRWHQNPDMNDCNETLAEHQWMVAALALWLRPEMSRDELIDILMHDVGELRVGDIAAPDRDGDCTWISLHVAAEAVARRAITGRDDHSEPAGLRYIVDRLAAYVKMMRHNPGLRHLSEWQVSRERIKSVAHGFGFDVHVKVCDLIEQMHRRADIMGGWRDDA